MEFDFGKYNSISLSLSLFMSQFFYAKCSRSWNWYDMMNAHEYHNNICHGDSWIRSMQIKFHINVITGLFNYLVRCPRWALSCVWRPGRKLEKRVFHSLWKNWWLIPHGWSYNRIVFDLLTLLIHCVTFLSGLCFVFICPFLHEKFNFYSWCTMILIFDAFFNASFAQYDWVQINFAYVVEKKRHHAGSMWLARFQSKHEPWVI